MIASATSPSPWRFSARRTARSRSLWLAAVTLLLVLLCGLSVSIGSRSVAWADIFAALGGRLDGVEQAAVAVRIPRTLLALLAGAALGLSGAVMQGVTRNPLADPGIFGVNMGASLAVVVGVAWFGIVSAQAYVRRQMLCLRRAF